MSSSYLEFIKNRVPMIFDGATGTEIQKMGPADKDFADHKGCNEYLNLSRPDILQSIHRSYLDAGANVIETNTFGGSRPKLKEFGLEDKVYEINKEAASLAKKCVQESKISEQQFVCGSIGPTGYLPSSSDSELSNITFDELGDIFEEQASALVDGGADILLIETSQDLLEVRAAVFGIKRMLRKKALRVPLQVQVTMDSAGHMLLGSDVKSFLGAVSALGVDVIGLNCSTGPDEMAPIVKKLLELSPLPVSVLPNAGLPCNVDGEAVYTMDPLTFAQKLAPMVSQWGVSVVGGCCGTTPEHIRSLSENLSGERVFKRNVPQRVCYLSTGISGLDLETVKRPLIIGERLNTQGSKKTREFAIKKDYDELCQIASQQAERGSTLIDICMAANELDNESESMLALVDCLKDRINIPFCVDTTEPDVMRAVLRQNPGSVLLNSINLEYKEKKAKEVLALAAEFGCPVVALTIDDEGMASTAQRKIELAKRIRDLACKEYGLPEHFVYIDPLVFTLATGDEASAGAAIESLEALRGIKKTLPGVRTVMGVSNVSFGLRPAARRVLNNLMLSHAVEAGLDAAIFNPHHIDDISSYNSEEKKLGEELLFNSNPDALNDFVNYFESKRKDTTSINVANMQKTLSPEDNLRRAVIERDRRGLKEIIEETLYNKQAKDILNKILLPAMSEVGEKMAKGEMILPFVLQAAEVMKEAVAILEPHLKGGDSSVKGKMILATVYGDVHDIGKNLVGSILSNQGYEIFDLGKQVSVDEIVSSVREKNPDAVGLSALLVTTSREMAQCVKVFHREGIRIPVIIGGAAVNRDFANRISTLENGEKYPGGVYYARDAFEAGKILESIKNEKIKSEDREAKLSAAEVIVQAPEISHESEYLEPPFYGTGEVLIWDSEQLLGDIDKSKLFKAWWGGGKLSQTSYKSAEIEEFGPVYDRLRTEIINDELLDPRGFYGFFPVFADKEEMILLDPGDFHSELASFKFPRGKKSGRAITDYIRPLGDVIAVQAVTVGFKLGKRISELFKDENKYSDGFYLNGIGNYIVELLAEKITTEIRRAFEIPRNQGRRYSFGYTGMPGLEEQKTLFEIAGVGERLGIQLTSGFQMDPEHSTIGIFIHHPDAQYIV
ncbi:methionine synthase [Chitinispirillum alkaliphilum]|nr:methionine synthase [Chitinispirillum alkaliphilum]